MLRRPDDISSYALSGDEIIENNRRVGTGRKLAVKSQLGRVVINQ